MDLYSASKKKLRQSERLLLRGRCSCQRRSKHPGRRPVFREHRQPRDVPRELFDVRRGARFVGHTCARSVQAEIMHGGHRSLPGIRGRKCGCIFGRVRKGARLPRDDLILAITLLSTSKRSILQRRGRREKNQGGKRDNVEIKVGASQARDDVQFLRATHSGS
jgi:hypothetical protein